MQHHGAAGFIFWTQRDGDWNKLIARQLSL